MSRMIFTALVWCLLTVLAQADDREADVSLQLGIVNLRAKKFQEACEPLEAAFRSATTARTKMRAAEALMVAYRETASFEKYLVSADFVISHSEHQAGRSVNSSQVGGFVHFNGKTDAAITRYEAKLKDNADDLAALNVLTQIYKRSDREDKNRARELEQKLSALDKSIASTHAKRLEAEAAKQVETAAWNLKDAAQFWLEAGEPKAALVAAKASVAATPESRSQILSYQWHEGLGDVFMQANEPMLAAKEFEAAVKAAPEGILKTNVQKKLHVATGKSK